MNNKTKSEDSKQTTMSKTELMPKDYFRAGIIIGLIISILIDIIITFLIKPL